MFRSPATIAGFGIAILIVAVMGILVFTGPFHEVNKPTAVSTHPPAHIKIVTDPTIAGRYVPHSITVYVGQTVIVSNVSDAVHTLTADKGAFDTGDITTSGTTSTRQLVVPKAGTFKYYCKYHPDMHGVLVVKS